MIKKAEPEERLAFAKRLYQEKLLIQNNYSFAWVFSGTLWNKVKTGLFLKQDRQLDKAMSSKSFASLDHAIRNDRFMQVGDCKTQKYFQRENFGK